MDLGRSWLSCPHRKLIFLRDLFHLQSPASAEARILVFWFVVIFQDDGYPGPVDSTPATSCITVSASLLIPAFVPVITCPEVNRPALHALRCSQNILFQA